VDGHRGHTIVLSGLQRKRSHCILGRAIRLVLLGAVTWPVCGWRTLSAAGDVDVGDAGTMGTSLILMQIPARQPLGGVPSRLDGLMAPPPGSRIARVDLSNPEQQPMHLTSEFEAAGGPSLSYDSRRVLFVGRRSASEPMGVWEMNVDGTETRHVYTPPGGCDRAIYLSTLYTIDAPEPIERIAFRAVGYGGKPQLFSCGPQGEDVQQITYAPGGVTDPYLLSDGRLLFGMRSGVIGDVAGEGAGNAWFTINTDGTDVFPFAAVSESPAIRSTPCETAGGTVVYVENTPAVGRGTSALVSVSLARSMHTRRVMTQESGGTYYAPAPRFGDELTVSYRDEAAGTFGVYSVHVTGDFKRSKLFDDPAWHDVDAAIVQSRSKPPGRSSVVRNTTQIGRLYCLDAYISDTPEGAAITDGQISRFRIITPETAGDGGSRLGASAGAESKPSDTVLGGGTIDADGSFSLELPARLPFRIETMDEGGRILQSMRTWMWVMPMERRGCIGCHEDRELTPPNRHVIALRKPPQLVGLDRINNVGEATTTYQKPGGEE